MEEARPNTERRRRFLHEAEDRFGDVEEKGPDNKKRRRFLAGGIYQTGTKRHRFDEWQRGKKNRGAQAHTTTHSSYLPTACLLIV